MKERKQFTKEFKEGAVRLVTDQGRTIGDAAQSLGISPWTMSRWVKAAKNEGADAFRGQGQRTAEQQELFELRQRVRQLEEERAIRSRLSALKMSCGRRNTLRMESKLTINSNNAQRPNEIAIMGVPLP